MLIKNESYAFPVEKQKNGLNIYQRDITVFLFWEQDSWFRSPTAQVIIPAQWYNAPVYY